MHVDSIILAAGRGSRMNNQTSLIPKCCVTLFGKELLQWQLQTLRAAKIEEITVVCGYEHKKINCKAKKRVNFSWQSTNMVYSLFSTVAPPSHRRVVSYSDIVYSTKILPSVLKSEADIVIPVNTDWLRIWRSRFVDPRSDAETLRLDETSKVIEIGKKIDKLENVHGQFMGLLYTTKIGWNILLDLFNSLGKEVSENIDMTGFLALAIDNGITVEAMKTSEMWFEFDSESDLQLVEHGEYRDEVLASLQENKLDK